PARIRKGDQVEVTAGKDRGRRGAVLSVDPGEGRVVVERLNMVWKHQKPTGTGRGGRLEKENPVHISNVALGHKGERTRGRRRVADGKKVRWSVKHDEAIDG